MARVRSFQLRRIHGSHSLIVPSDELRRLGRRAIVVNIGWAVEALAGLLLVGYATRVIAPADYGVLVFATSVASLLMLLDLGTTGLLVPALVRESRRAAEAALATLFATSLAALVLAGSAVLILSVVSATLTPALTQSAELATADARTVIMLLGVAAALTLPSRAYELLFEAHARFGALAIARGTSAAFRLCASVAVLKAGYGIIGVAVVSVALAALRLIAYAVGARIVFPYIRPLAPRDWSMLRRLARPAAWVAVDNTSRQVMMMSDAALLAVVAPVNAVATYGVASRVPLLLWSAVGKALGVSMQAAAEHDAAGNDAGVREVFRSTAVLATTIVWPILIVAMVFSEPFLRAWVGPTYASGAATMRWLLVAGIAFALHAAAHGVLYARSRVDVIAKISIVEGIANVVLSLALGYRYGAPGPAFATALTVSVATLAAFIPWACRTVDLPLATLVRDIASHATIPLVAVTSIAVALRQLLPGDPIVQCTAAAVLAALCAARLPLLIHASPRGTARPRPVADAG